MSKKTPLLENFSFSYYDKEVNLGNPDPILKKKKQISKLYKIWVGKLNQVLKK